MARQWCSLKSSQQLYRPRRLELRRRLTGQFGHLAHQRLGQLFPVLEFDARGRDRVANPQDDISRADVA